MDDELLEPGVNETPEVNEEAAAIHSENEGYSVLGTGLIANLESHREEADEKSDVEVNIKAASALAMEIQEATLLKGAYLLARVAVTPFTANCPRLIWQSTNEEVVVVDDNLNGSGLREDGLAMVYAVGVGEAQVKAVAENGLSCTMSLEVVVPVDPETLEVDSTYAFNLFEDEAETASAEGTVKVLSVADDLAKISVLTIDPDDPEETWVEREFYVDADLEVGDGNKHALYEDAEKTEVSGITIEITEKVGE
jgi:hypothetical protein